LQHHGIPQYLLVNRLNLQMVTEGEMMGQDDVMEILAIDLLGVVIEDGDVVVSGNQGVPTVLNKDSRAGQAYQRITRRLMGENIPIPSFEEKKGFFSKIFGRKSS
jgi:septum site-determining protein MinD